MTRRPGQRELPLAPRHAPARETVEPFEFNPGPECEPRPEWVIPDELRLPFDPETGA